MRIGRNDNRGRMRGEGMIVAALLVVLLVLVAGLGASGSKATAKKSAPQNPANVPGPEAYGEITTKPYGVPGVVNEFNLMVWGVAGWRRGGDAYSGAFGVGNGQVPNLTPNPEYPKQPYGYLYHVNVPASYTYTHLLVQFFDPDSYNRPGSPPAMPTPYPCPGPQCGSPTPTPSADVYASCTNPRSGGCTSNGADYDSGMKLNAFPNGRPAFWRTEELRTPYNRAFTGEYNATNATTTQYTLWHFSPHITSAFGDPALLSDQLSGTYLSRYMVGWDAYTDLSWYRPPGFDIQLQDSLGNDLFGREQSGGLSFYLYVQGIAGSSENNFDIRVGPPDLNSTQLCTTPCSINQLYLNNSNNPTSYPDWADGGATIFAKHALPLNANTGAGFPFILTQVSISAAGQTLGVRHFDQDCNNGCGSQMQYQMQVCGCSDLTNPACWANVAVGFVGPNDDWSCPGTANDTGCPANLNTPDPEQIQIPAEGTALYTTLFGSAGQCPTSWLRVPSNPSYSGDTTTWEMPYASLQGHVIWQGPPAQADAKQALPITLTLSLQSGGPNNEFTGLATDTSGWFTMPVGTLPSGTYNWRVKGPKYLATSGTVSLTAGVSASAEMSLMLAGDCNNSNNVSSPDFTILRATFGKSSGQPGYDDRADFDNNQAVGASDFSLLRANFGTAGAP
jgi:hypothetical protein